MAMHGLRHFVRDSCSLVEDGSFEEDIMQGRLLSILGENARRDPVNEPHDYLSGIVKEPIQGVLTSQFD
jgi:hypothetical protein